MGCSGGCVGTERFHANGMTDLEDSVDLGLAAFGHDINSQEFCLLPSYKSHSISQEDKSFIQSKTGRLTPLAVLHRASIEPVRTSSLMYFHARRNPSNID